MLEKIFLVSELIGTVAFSISGAIAGIKKEMDIFGVITLGLTTACGGGCIRDIILGITPPAVFQNPLFAAVSVLTSIIVFVIVSVRDFKTQKHRVYDFIMLLTDSVGLGIFSVIGVQTAYNAGYGDNIFLLTFVGMVTGAGGGVLRDIFSQEKPYIFVKHFYACASAIGSLICIILWKWSGGWRAMLLGAVTVVVLRLLAAYFHWKLPKSGYIQSQEKN